MDGQGLIQSMTAHLHQLAAGGGGNYPIPSTLPPHLLAAQAANIPPRLDPQATAMFNARLEMLNTILINQLMSVAGLPAPPPAIPERPPVANRTGERIGGNTVAPPSIMRQQARREREALQREARGGGGGGGRQNRSYNQGQQQQQNQYRGQVTFHKKIDDDSGILSSATKSSDEEGTSAKIDRAQSRIITDEDRAEIIARLTDAIVQWFLNHYNITESDVDAVPKAAVWDKARMHLPLELGKRVFFNQLMKGLKMQGKRIRIKNSMVLRVKMKENLKPIEEEGSNIGDETLSNAAAEAAAMGAGGEEEVIEDHDEDDQPQQEEHSQQKDLEYNENVTNEMDRELKRCLGLLTDDTPAKKERIVSVDAEVQADIGEEPLQLLPKDVVRTKAMAAVHKQNMSPSSVDGNNLQDRSLIPWHQITSTPSLLQGKAETSQMPQELTPIMAATGRTSSLSEKTNNSGSVHTRRSGSLEHSFRRGSTGSQRRPQRPAKRLRSRESRSSRSSLAQLKADSAPETETSMDNSHSSGVFSSDNPPPRQLDTTASASDSELCRRDYGRHNIAQFLSNFQTPDSPSQSKSASSRSLGHDAHDRPPRNSHSEHRGSTSERRLSTSERRPSTSTSERQPSTSERRASTSTSDRHAGDKRAAASDRPASTSDRRASSSDWRSTNNDHHIGNDRRSSDWKGSDRHGSTGDRRSNSGDWRSSTNDRRSSASDWRPNSGDRRSSASDWRSGDRKSSSSNWRANRSQDSDHSRTEQDMKHTDGHCSPCTVDGRNHSSTTHKRTSPHMDGKEKKSLIETQAFLSAVQTLFESLRATKTDASTSTWTIKSLALHSEHVQCGQLAFKSVQQHTTLKDLGEMLRADLTSDLSSCMFWSGEGCTSLAVYQVSEGAFWVPIAIIELKEKPYQATKTSAPPIQPVKQGEGIDEVDKREKEKEREKDQVKMRSNHEVSSVLVSKEQNHEQDKSGKAGPAVDVSAACKVPLPEKDTDSLEQKVQIPEHRSAGKEVQEDKTTEVSGVFLEKKCMVEVVMIQKDQVHGMALGECIAEKEDIKNEVVNAELNNKNDANIKDEVPNVELNSKNDANIKDEAGDIEFDNKNDINKKGDADDAELNKNYTGKEEHAVTTTEHDDHNNKDVANNMVQNVEHDNKSDANNKEKTANSHEDVMNKVNEMKTAEKRDPIEESYKTLELEITDELAKEMADSILSFKAMHGYWEKLGDSLNDSPDHHHGRKHETKEKTIDAIPKLATTTTVSDLLQRSGSKNKPKEEAWKGSEETRKEADVTATNRKSDNEELWDIAMNVAAGKHQMSATSQNSNLYSSFDSLDAEVAANTQEDTDEGIEAESKD